MIGEKANYLLLTSTFARDIGAPIDINGREFAAKCIGVYMVVGDFVDFELGLRTQA